MHTPPRPPIPPTASPSLGVRLRSGALAARVEPRWVTVEHRVGEARVTVAASSCALRVETAEGPAFFLPRGDLIAGVVTPEPAPDCEAAPDPRIGRRRSGALALGGLILPAAVWWFDPAGPETARLARYWAFDPAAIDWVGSPAGR